MRGWRTAGKAQAHGDACAEDGVRPLVLNRWARPVAASGVTFVDVGESLVSLLDQAKAEFLELALRGREQHGVPVHGFETPICAYAATDIGLI